MAYTTPRTWVTGELVTAAYFNTHLRDNLNAAFPLGIDAWTTFTPALTQGGAVTKTVTYARYQRIGRLIVGTAHLSVTGTGTATTNVAIGVPVTAAAVSGFPVVGSGWIGDNSAGDTITGVAYLASTTTVQLVSSRATGNILGNGGGFAAALANLDTVVLNFAYEAAT